MGRFVSFNERRRRPVVFRYPDGAVKKFQLVDEVSLDASQDRYEHGDYYYLIQQLKDQDGEELIRMTYYRRPPGGDQFSWNFAGQTSLTTSRANWVRLLRKAIEKDWFKSLLDDARRGR